MVISMIKHLYKNSFRICYSKPHLDPLLEKKGEDVIVKSDNQIGFER